MSVSLWCRSNQTVCKEKHNNSSSNMSIYKTNDSNYYYYYYNLKHTLAAHNEDFLDMLQRQAQKEDMYFTD